MKMINSDYNGKQALFNYEGEVLELVMQKNKYNQSAAAIEMGMSRATFRKKIFEHFGSRYFGSRRLKNV